VRASCAFVRTGCRSSLVFIYPCPSSSPPDYHISNFLRNASVSFPGYPSSTFSSSDSINHSLLLLFSPFIRNSATTFSHRFTRSLPLRSLLGIALTASSSATTIPHQLPQQLLQSSTFDSKKRNMHSKVASELLFVLRSPWVLLNTNQYLLGIVIGYEARPATPFSSLIFRLTGPAPLPIPLPYILHALN